VIVIHSLAEVVTEIRASSRARCCSSSTMRWGACASANARARLG